MYTLQKVSGFWFFVLGLLFVVSYVLLRGELMGAWPAYILQYADLPFILSAMVYGGTSLLISLKSPKGSSTVLTVMLCILGFILFAAVCAMNFWR